MFDIYDAVFVYVLLLCEVVRLNTDTTPTTNRRLLIVLCNLVNYSKRDKITKVGKGCEETQVTSKTPAVTQREKNKVYIYISLP